MRRTRPDWEMQHVNLCDNQHLMATTSDGLRLSIAVGIVIGVFASFVQSLGMTIQRKSHVQNQSMPEEQQKVEHRRP
jgi:hypothetical protein